MSKFAVSMFATRRGENGSDIFHYPVVVEAENEYEAIGKGLVIINKIKPGEEGWQQHHCAAQSAHFVITDPNDLKITPKT